MNKLEELSKNSNVGEVKRKSEVATQKDTNV